MKAFAVVRELVKLGLTGVTIEYEEASGLYSYDLNTKAKSELKLFDDFHVEGRYSYSNRIDPEQEVNEILKDLFYEFKGCIHGRDFFNSDWMEIGVKLGCVEKKVTTTTNVSYE